MNLTREQFRKKLEQGEEYSTSLFNNPGFWIGSFTFLLSFSSLFWDNSTKQPLIIPMLISLLGLSMIYNTPYIKIKSDTIEFQPLLFKLLHLKILNKIVAYSNISRVTKKITAVRKYSISVIVVTIHTKDSKKYKLDITYFPEIKYILHEFLNSKIKSIS
jgi:hypothetical protein